MIRITKTKITMILLFITECNSITNFVKIG